MKTFTFAQLRKLCKDQDYKMAALQGPQGDRIVPFNQYKKNGSNLEGQFKIMETRLKADHNPDGVYFVLLAYNIKSAQNPQSFAITKGKVSPEDLAESEKKSLPVTPAIIVPDNKVLSWEGALKYQQDISDLKTENARLQMELNQANLRIEELESEEELSDEAPAQNNVLSFLKDALPNFMPLADKYFETENRKLDLKEMELRTKTNGQKAPKQVRRKEIIPASQEHLNLIEHYFKQDNEERLNQELDKLEQANPEIYRAVMERLGIGLEEEEGTEEGGENE